MSASHPILSRLDTGRPLLVSGDPSASLRARGVELHGPAALGRLLREHPAAVREQYHQDILAGVDVLACLTADTLPRALQQIGMPFRAAALTGSAVELALEAADLAPRPLIVAGVLGSAEVGALADDRGGEELATHAARLVAAGCELILARGFGSAAYSRLGRRVGGSAITQLPTWAVIALDWGGFTVDGKPADEAARRAFDEGAQVALFEIPNVEVGLGWVDRLLAAGERMASPAGLGGGDGHHVGFALAAGALDPDAWALQTHHLIDAGARVVGGGPGTTHRHLGALVGLLRGPERQSLWPAASRAL